MSRGVTEEQELAPKAQADCDCLPAPITCQNSTTVTMESASERILFTSEESVRVEIKPDPMVVVKVEDLDEHGNDAASLNDCQNEGGPGFDIKSAAIFPYTSLLYSAITRCGAALGPRSSFGSSFFTQNANEAGQESDSKNGLITNYRKKSNKQPSKLSNVKKKKYITPFRCNICQYKTTSLGNLKRHTFENHECESELKCPMCDHIAKRIDSLKVHIRSHSDGKPFKCHLCAYATNVKGSLKGHLLIHTGEKPFKCHICEYQTIQSNKLKRHLLTHTGEKPHKCHICDYTSAERGSLKRHILTHTGEKPYKCNLCYYAATNSANLKSHILTHTGEKPYKCRICEYTATHGSNLKSHMLIHTDEKPYKCKLCDYAARESSSLKKHLQVHSGEKNYKCHLCDYAATLRSSLRSHLITHSDEKKHKCHICDYSAKRIGNLKRHLLVHTDMQMKLEILACHNLLGKLAE